MFGPSFEDYKQEVRNAIHQREDYSDEAADNIVDHFEDDLRMHFDQGDKVAYVAALLCRRYDNEL